MKVVDSFNQLAINAFNSYYQSLFFYIQSRVHDTEKSEDILQDTFLRLLEMGDSVNAVKIKNFLFTVAHNIVVDRMRRRTKYIDVIEAVYYNSNQMSSYTQSLIIANDIEKVEMQIVNTLPCQRRNVYRMSRYGTIPIVDIADRLNIRPRTAESLLFLGRRDVRSVLRKAL